MSEQPNDMDPTEMMDEIRSLHLKLDSVIETLSSLNEKVNKINESQQMGAELVRKSANSINIAVRFMAGLRKLSHEELKNTLIDADAILNTVNPIPTHENVDETLEWNVTKVSLKTILKEVFDLLSSLPLDINVNANNPVASTSTEKKIQFWRRYKNKYNYIEHLKPKLPPLDEDGRPIRRVEPQQDGIVENNVNSIVQNNKNSVVQNDVNPIVQNDENSIVQNYVNPIVQNDENSIVQNGENSIVPNDENSIVQNGENSIVRNDENAIVPNDENSIVQNNVNATAQNGLNNKTTFTLNDIIQNAEVYEMFKSRLKNSPYEDPSFKNRVRNSQLTITLHNGQTIVRPVSHVAPLIVLKKCDDMCPIPLQNKETTDEHLPSTSSNINDSNRNNTIPKMIKRVTRSSKTNNATNSFNTNVKTTTRKRGSTKNSKCGPSKKKKN